MSPESLITRKLVDKILQLPMKDKKGNILLSINEILNNNFQEQSVVKNSHSCDNTAQCQASVNHRCQHEHLFAKKVFGAYLGEGGRDQHLLVHRNLVPG